MDGIAAPRAQREGKRHGVGGQFKHRRTGSVAEQHAGGAVGGIHQAGKGFAAHHQCIPPAQSRQQAAGNCRPVQKAGAGRVHVQRRTVFRQPQCRLYLTGHAWRGVRCRQGGTDTAADVRRGKAAALQRLLCGGNSKGGGILAVSAPVPGADSGAGGDPLVAGVHHAAEIFVCDRAAGQCPTGGDQTQTVHAFLISPIWRNFW